MGGGGGERCPSGGGIGDCCAGCRNNRERRWVGDVPDVKTAEARVLVGVLGFWATEAGPGEI